MVVSRLALLRIFGVVLATMTVWVCGAVGRLLWPGRRLAELGFGATQSTISRDLEELGLVRIRDAGGRLRYAELAEGTSVASIATRLANAVATRPQANEMLSLAERYEAADDDRLAAVADAADPFELKSEAAE